jgi:hypothetical protein
MSLSVNSASSTPSSALAKPDLSKEKVAVNKLVQQYSRDLQQGQTAAQLQTLAHQIQAAAQVAGENVRLPTAAAQAVSASKPAPTPLAASGNGGVLNKIA